MVEIYLYSTGKHTYTPTIKSHYESQIGKEIRKKKKIYINKKKIQHTEQIGLKSVYLQNIHIERQVIKSHISTRKKVYNTQQIGLKGIYSQNTYSYKHKKIMV